MKNYICFNGKKIELTTEQVAEMKKSLGIAEVKLSDIPTGEIFKIGEHEFIVLEHSEDTTAVILKKLLFESKTFGKNNDYRSSNMEDICDDFGTKIANIIGSGNLVEHMVDLTSDDGLKDYGKIKRKMSLLTADRYRRYVEILDKYKPDKWWWTATAYSTPTHNHTSWVKCVSPDGSISSIYCGDDGGVRPFCILKSNIFVSK